MKYLFQFLRILVFCLLGELLHFYVPLPIPASIYGLVLLLLALKAGIVKLNQVKETANFLTGILRCCLFRGRRALWSCGICWRQTGFRC